MSARPAILSGAALLLLQVPATADEAAAELPDAALLEYLGSWEGTDEDWLLFSDPSGTDAQDERDGQPDGAGGIPGPLPEEKRDGN